MPCRTPSTPFALSLLLALAAASPARAQLMSDFLRYQATLGLGAIGNDRAIVSAGPLGTEYRDASSISSGGLSLGVTVTRYWPALAAGGFLEASTMDGPQVYAGALGGAKLGDGLSELDFLTELGLHWIPGLAEELANQSTAPLRFAGVATPMVQPFVGLRVVTGRRAGVAGRKLLGLYASYRHDLATWGPEAFQGDPSSGKSVTFESRGWQFVVGVTLAVASPQE